MCWKRQPCLFVCCALHLDTNNTPLFIVYPSTLYYFVNIYAGRSKWQVKFLEFLCAICVYQTQNADYAMNFTHGDPNLLQKIAHSYAVFGREKTGFPFSHSP